MNKQELRSRKRLFGRVSDAFLPLKPFYWQTPAGDILEIPVTTIPVFRSPFHLTYLLWLSRFSKSLALTYMRFALNLCRFRSIEPSFLLHPLDFLGKEDVPELAFFPGMDLPRSYKLDMAETLLGEIQKNFDVVKMSEHARRAGNISRSMKAF